MSARAPHVVVAGGGVAGIEALLALHELLAGGVELTLVSPHERFCYRPLAVAEPFAPGAVPTLPLAAIAGEHNAAFLQDAIAAVDPDARTATTRGGGRIAYDELVLAVGARQLPVAPGLTRFGDPADAPAVADVVRGVRAGTVRRVGLTAPIGAAWTLPLYELALALAAERDPDGRAPTVLLVTPEARPLERFGREISDGVVALLDECGVRVHAGAVVERFEAGELWVEFEGAVPVDAAIALPPLAGPEVDGLPRDRDGFVPVDAHARVEGEDHLYAAGDMCALPIKQGGLAAQQADAAAAHIAWRLGATPAPAPIEPVLRAVLMTGAEPRYLRARLAGRHPADGITREAPWWPPAKIAARRLAPYLAQRLGSPGSSGRWGSTSP